jgi:hypothetical protein
MEQKKKSNFTFLLIALGGVLLATTLFTTLGRGCGAPQAVIPELSEQDRGVYTDYVLARSRSPKDFILDAFRDHDVVYLGDSFSHNNYQIVRQAVSGLLEKGVGAIGVEFALADDQDKIDALLTADEYDEDQTRDILTNQFVSIAYQESLQLFRQVWTINHGLPRSARPLRILGLGVKIQAEYFSKKEYRDNKELQKKALGGRTLDEGFFLNIDREVIRKKARALLYMSTYNCFENVRMKTLDAYYKDLGLEFKGTAAMLSRAALGDRQTCLMFHNAWPLNEQQVLLFPMGGVLDAVIKALPSDKRDAGFAVAGSPFAEMAVAEGFKGTDDKPVRLLDLGEGYILNGELSSYRFTPLAPGSINAARIEKIYRVMGVDPAEAKAKTPEEFIALYNDQIEATNKEFAALPH